MLAKLEQLIFYLFLFSIPFQTRKILYFEGWRFNEWQSVSIYGTDILLALLFLFWAAGYFKQGNKFSIFNFSRFRENRGSSTKSGQFSINLQLPILKKPDFYLFLFIIISAMSIKNSDNFIISWYQWAKLAEFVGFYWYLSHCAFKKFGIFESFLAIFFSGLVQALIAIIQFLKQSNIGLKYLGESVLNSDFSGVATFYVSSTEKIIRAYGTTPHPNVLAVFLLLALFAFYFIYLYSRLHSEHPPMADSWDKFFLWSSGVMLFGFFTTFSRTVIFVWFVTFCARGITIVARKHYRIIFGTKEGRDRIRAILLVSFLTIILFGTLYFHESISRLTISGDDQSVVLRSFYAQEALKADTNLFGIGHGNFMTWLIKENPFLPSYAYQPVHNIYLLIYAETGILGISTFILFLAFLIKDFILKTRLKKSYHLSFLFLFSAVMFVGLFDHMFWTLQQGRIIFWLSLALLGFSGAGLTFSKKGAIIEERSDFQG